MYRMLICIFAVSLVALGTVSAYANDWVSDEHSQISVSISGNDKELDAAVSEAGDRIKKTISGLIVGAITEGEIDDSEMEAAVDEIQEIVSELVTEAGGGEEGIKELLSYLGKANDAHSDYDTSFGDFAVGALTVTFIFGTPLLIVAAILFASYKKRQLAHRTVIRMIDEGKEIPEEILSQLRGGTLPKGLVWTGIGLGTLACFTAMGFTKAAFLGLIPLCIGFAILLNWKLDKDAKG